MTGKVRDLLVAQCRWVDVVQLVVMGDLLRQLGRDLQTALGTLIRWVVDGTSGSAANEDGGVLH